MVRLVSASKAEEEVEITEGKEESNKRSRRRTCGEENLIRLLPEEIMLNMISRLAVDSVLHCRCVCKNWRNLLPLLRDNNTYFADMHLSHPLQKDSNNDTKLSFVYLGTTSFNSLSLSYVEYDESDVQSYNKHKRLTLPIPADAQSVVGSCNGLICLAVLYEPYSLDPIYICNPITREFVYLPRLIENKKHKLGYIAQGFGYHSSTDEYKVVRVYYCRGEQPLIGHVQVYTLGSGIGWRNKGEIIHILGPTVLSHGILLDGALHWISMEGNIVAFNLADEEFRCRPMPPFSSPDMYMCSTIWVLGGCLCVYYWKTGKDAEIWLLKKNKKKNEEKQTASSDEQSWSWNREFTITIKDIDSYMYHYQPFTITKSGEILLWCDGKSILCCDSKPAAIAKKIVDLDEVMYGEQAMSHFNSFVSLKALGENAEIL